LSPVQARRFGIGVPVYANLFAEEDGMARILIRSRDRVSSNGD
jgi:hypothetical protein